MPTDYEKAQAKYRELQQKSAANPSDKALREDKVKASLEVRQIEREAARSGTHLIGGRQVAQGRSKRSLQEEYVGKFDNETPVELPEKAGEPPRVTTLQKHHSKRLFGK